MAMSVVKAVAIRRYVLTKNIVSVAQKEKKHLKKQKTNGYVA